MLCRGDQALVAADTTLPGLGRLLDPDAFTDLLRSIFPEAGVASVRPRYVRYKPRTSCLVGAHATTAVGDVDLYARAHDPTHVAKIEKAVEFRAVRSILGPGTAVDRDSAIAIYMFPNDHELRAMRRLAEPEQRLGTLRRLLPDEFEVDGASLETLRYKPERRYVARVCTASGGAAAIKLYTEDDFRLVRKSVKAFESRAPLRVAETLRRSKGLQATVVEWLPGTPLSDALTVAGCETAGAALAAAHEQRPDRLRRKRAAGPAAGAVPAILDLVPDLADAAAKAARRIDRALRAERRPERSAVHGDFSADQVVIDGDVAGFIDFDRAGWGDGRLDLGSFRARLTSDVLWGRREAADADAGFAALLAGYRSVGREIGAIEPFAAAALLRLATEPFRYRHRDWPERIAAIVAEANRMVTTAASDV